MKRFLALCLLAFGVTTASAQITPRVITTASDPNGNACTATTPPTILLYNSGSTFTTYTCQSSVWTAAAVSAATATALASNPTDCSAGQYATTIAASGDLTCAAVPNEFDSNTVTVCSDSAVCDYTTIQSALDATTATSSARKTVLVYPGTYSECVTLDDNDDYLTVRGVSRDSVRVNCSTSGDHAFAWEPSSSTDLLGFVVENMTILAQGGGTSHGVYIDAETNVTSYVTFDVTVRDCDVYGYKGAVLFLTDTADADPDGVAVAESTVSGNHLESEGWGVFVAGPQKHYSADNVMVIGSDVSSENKCWSDHGGANGVYSGTSFVSQNDYCTLVGDVDLSLDPPCGLCLYTGQQYVTVNNLVLDIKANTTTNGAHGYMFGDLTTGGSSSGMSMVYISGGTVLLRNTAATQTAYGLRISTYARVYIKGVTFRRYGPGTYYEMETHSGTTDNAYIRHSATTATSTANNGNATLSETK